MFESFLYHFFEKSLGNRFLYREVKRGFGMLPFFHLVRKIFKDTSRKWKKWKMILELCKTSDSFSIHFESWYSIWNTLNCAWKELMKHCSKILKSFSFKWIFYICNIEVNFIHITKQRGYIQQGGVLRDDNSQLPLLLLT